MPIYEFECQKCKAHIEVLQKVSAKPPSKCVKCGGRLERVASAPAIQFKGSGWYVTDYATKATKSDKSESESTAGDEKSTADDDKKADKKPKESSPAKKSSEKASPPKAPSGD
jgi:putative FmdB family regulatory protein